MIIAYLKQSENDSKNKYTVIVTDRLHKKTIHFGANGYSDYTKHKDIDRKELSRARKSKISYIKRHSKNEDWNDPFTAGFWSKNILWNKPTINESIKDTAKKYQISIRAG